MQNASGIFLSPAQKRRVRDIVRQSNDPKEMEASVVEAVGEYALHEARQIAAQEKGFEWLRQERHPMAHVRLDAPATAALHPAGQSPSHAVSEVMVGREGDTAPFGWRLGNLAARLWQFELVKFFCCIGAIFALGFIAISYSKYRQAEDFKAERASVGPSASVAGAAWASATRSCNTIGIKEVRDCANNTGLLLQDTAAKAVAEVAVAQVAAYMVQCEHHFSQQYCLDLVNRAYRISFYSRD